ncbi:MAG: hypothetical protein V4651_13910, partial [Bacteroidota bacterium]
MKHNTIVLLFLFFIYGSGWSQSLTEAGNYNGIDVMTSNPSAPVFSRLEYDIRLFSVEAFSANNFVSINSIYADRFLYQKRSHGRVFANVEVTGPSVLFVKNSWAWG